MGSNTKLSKFDKQELQSALMELSKKVYSFDFCYDTERGITVLLVTPFKGANTCHIATSIMSPDEKKFRKSVGRAYALYNYTARKYIDTPAMVNVSVFDNI